MRFNKETVGPATLINPHNEALAQWPLADAEKRLNEAEKFLGEKLGPGGKFLVWKQKYFLGGPTSAGWEEFDDLVAEATGSGSGGESPPEIIEPPTDERLPPIEKRP